MRDCPLSSVLTLGTTGITGPIPPQLGLLASNLQYLDLRSVPISGTFPTTFTLLTKLKWVERVSPDTCGRITAPARMSSYLVPCYWRCLRYLHVGGCLLSGPLPSTIAGLTNLQQLVLSSNAFTGSTPSFLSSLQALTYVAKAACPDRHGQSDCALSDPHDAVACVLWHRRQLEAMAAGLTGTTVAFLQQLPVLGYGDACVAPCPCMV